MEGLTWPTFGMIWVTLGLLSFGQICLKLGLSPGIQRGATMIGSFRNLVVAMVAPKMLLGFFLYVIGTFIWLVVLSKVPLNIAFPMFSMSYFLVVILSATILKERVQWRYAIAGLVLISAGVTFIGLSSPPKHAPSHAIKRHTSAPVTNGWGHAGNG